MMFSIAGLEIRHHFIADFEAFEMDDADEFITVFPNLALLKFQRHAAPPWGGIRLSVL